MTLSSIPGPCGLTLAQIIDSAGGLRRGAGHCGVRDVEELNSMLQEIGCFLSSELTGKPVEQAKASYEARVHAITPEAVAALTAAEVRPTCLAVGWSTGPALDAETRMAAAVSLLRTIKIMQGGLGASTSEMRDLLVWLQCVVIMGKVLGVPPEPSKRRRGARRHRRAHSVRH